MTATELVGLVTGILTILGVIVGITRYVTQLQFKVRQERLEAEKEQAEQRVNDIDARYKELLKEIAISRRVGTAALTRKMEIDDELSSIMKVMRAQAGSIYIPLSTKSSSEPIGLVFLSIQPFAQQSATLKRKIIPMSSSAGHCFRSGKPYTSPDSKTDPAHYGQADQVSGYHTEDMLNYPLKQRGEVVGVLQLLNKEGPERFKDEDIPTVEPFTMTLAEKVFDFTRARENFEILGVMQERESEYATVMLCDLTRSSLLFREMSVSAAIQHVNEYLERICEIGLSHGATVDKYIGDGVLLKFNVPRRVKDHPFKAVIAARQMAESFDQLKTDWITMGEPLTNLYNRVGIAYGEVHEAAIGHPQYQYLTLFGQPVNIAVNLCEAAARDRNVIVIDEKLYQALSGKIQAERLPKERMGKALSYARAAFELKGVIRDIQ